VGNAEGEDDGMVDGDAVGLVLGLDVGAFVGNAAEVGSALGAVGDAVGPTDGDTEGLALGDAEGECDGPTLGLMDWPAATPRLPPTTSTAASALLPDARKASRSVPSANAPRSTATTCRTTSVSDAECGTAPSCEASATSRRVVATEMSSSVLTTPPSASSARRRPAASANADAHRGASQRGEHASRTATPDGDTPGIAPASAASTAAASDGSARKAGAPTPVNEALATKAMSVVAVGDRVGDALGAPELGAAVAVGLADGPLVASAHRGSRVSPHRVAPRQNAAGVHWRPAGQSAPDAHVVQAA
jgi:hypothetical protein